MSSTLSMGRFTKSGETYHIVEVDDMNTMDTDYGDEDEYRYGYAMIVWKVRDE